MNTDRNFGKSSSRFVRGIRVIRGSFPIAFAALIAITLLVRAGVLLAPGALSADLDAYRAIAENLVEHGTFGHGDVPSAYRPPLYPLILTLAVVFGPWSRVAIGLIHLGLGLGTVWITYWLGRRWGLGRFALVAAGLVALDPILMAQSAQVMTETLAAFLAVALLALLTWTSERPLPLRAMAAGACLGLAILCRPTFLPWAGLVALLLPWLASTWSGRGKTFLAFSLAVAAVLAPWAVRNQIQFGRPMVTTTHGGYTFLLANNPYFYEHLRSGEPGSIWLADELNRDLANKTVPDELAADRIAYCEAWEHIRREPAMFVDSCLVRVGRLWSPLPQLGQAWMRYAVGLWYLIEYGLAIVGMWIIARRGMGQLEMENVGQSTALTPALSQRERGWMWGWLWAGLLAAVFTAVHAFYWTDLRMRAPLMPAVALAAALGAAAILARASQRKSRGERELQNSLSS